MTKIEGYTVSVTEETLKVTDERTVGATGKSGTMSLLGPDYTVTYAIK